MANPSLPLPLRPHSNMPEPSTIQRIAIVGFGEVGGIFGNDFAKQGIEVSVYDILLRSRRHQARLREKAGSCGVRCAANLKDCLRGADLVISAVTASSSLSVAKDASAILKAKQIFLDINSVSPETKRKAARSIRPSGAHFVEAAVIAPVPGQRLKVPMLLGGDHAVETSESLRGIGMNTTALSKKIGVASAVKMCRSVVMKGLEALAVECLFAARQYAAEDAVLDSLAATYPSLGWNDHFPDYLISRVAEHGQRRADELREVAKALRAVGIKPTMALATVQRQESLVHKMGARKLSYKTPFSWRSLADTIGKDNPHPASRRSRSRT